MCHVDTPEFRVIIYEWTTTLPLISIMKISNDAFDFVFKRRAKVERKIENLSAKIDNSLDKLQDLISGPINANKEKRINKWLGVLDRHATKLDNFQAEFDRLTGIELPRDEFEMTARPNEVINGQPFASFDLRVADSPYDDTYRSGSKLKLLVEAERRNGGQRSRYGIATRFNDEDRTVVVGSSTFGDTVENYDDITVTLLNSNGDTLTTLSL